MTFSKVYKAYYDENKNPLSLHLSDNLMNLNDEIELIEDKKIDIDSIEKLEIIEEMVQCPTGGNQLIYKAKEPRLIGLVTNELIQAVKQLNRELKEIKENKENE